MRRIGAIIGLQALAVLLAWQQMGLDLRTDEAKYLLNIPYPHPPLARWVMELSDGWAHQELFWRIVFATLMLQAVWLVISLVPKKELKVRVTLGLFWIMSAAVLLQTGAIYMATLTALQALVFGWLAYRPELIKKYPAIIGLWWLISLFTAYQIVLFLPLVWWVLSKTNLPKWWRSLIILVPMGLLALYVLTNPLVIASFVRAGTQNSVNSVLINIWGIAEVWLLGGSVFIAVIATYAMVRQRYLELLLSLVLLMVYIYLNYRLYYAVLFTPLFILALARVHYRLCQRCLLYGTLLATSILVSHYIMDVPEITTKEVIAQIEAQDPQGYLLINGSFGHQWQHRSLWPVRKFNSERLDQAGALVCLESCVGLSPKQWSRLEDIGDFEVWIR